MKIKSAFILHSFPMLYSPECIPELGEKEDFYALIPTEELALLNNSTWPVVIDHVDEKERSVGNCSAKIIDTSFLFSNDIKVDLKKCTIEDIKNFNKWDETSTSFSYNIIKLEPYEFVDTKGISGNVGDKFLIKYHIINLQPIHLAIVEHGRTGYKGMLRKPLKHSLDNSIDSVDNIVKSDIIISNSIKSLCIANNKVLSLVEKQKKVEDSKNNSENIENSDNKEIKNETSELTLDSIKSMFMELVSPMVTKLDSLENKVNSMFSEDDSNDEDDEKITNKKKSSKLKNSKASEDDEEDEDDDEEDEDEDDDEEDDDEEDEDEDDDGKIENSKSLKASKNKSSKKKEVIFNSSDIKRQLKAALLEIAPALKNAKSDEDEKDPYDSFAQRYKN